MFGRRSRATSVMDSRVISASRAASQETVPQCVVRASLPFSGSLARPVARTCRNTLLHGRPPGKCSESALHWGRWRDPRRTIEPVPSSRRPHHHERLLRGVWGRGRSALRRVRHRHEGPRPVHCHAIGLAERSGGAGAVRAAAMTGAPGCSPRHRRCPPRPRHTSGAFELGGSARAVRAAILSGASSQCRRRCQPRTVPRRIWPGCPELDVSPTSTR